MSQKQNNFMSKARSCRWLARWVIICSAAILAGMSSLSAADSVEEQQLSVLMSNGSPREKDAACLRLKLIGTAASVPALAKLLTDEQLSISARNALEAIPSSAAGAALTTALDTTSGLVKAGIIQSLGNRKEVAAVSALIKLLGDSDINVSCASAVALGKIGTLETVKALQAALQRASAPLSLAISDGLLRAAYILLARGDAQNASQVFEKLYQSKQTDSLRTAAYAGMVRSAGKGALELVVKGITGTDGPARIAAFQLARELPGAETGKRLADLLPALSPVDQVALVGILMQRQETAAAAAIARLVTSGNAEVSRAAVEALGSVGDASVIPVLLKAATSPDASLQNQARQSLVNLRRGPVAKELLSQLNAGTSAEKAEAARALGERRELSAVNSLFQIAKTGDGATRKAAFEALAFLVQQEGVISLVQLVVEGPGDAARTEAAQALSSALHRLKNGDGKPNVSALAKALDTAPPEAKIALLPVCSSLVDAQIRKSMLSTASKSQEPVRSAAIRALCDSVDPGVLTDLVQLAGRTSEEKFRVLAIAGCVRLLSQEEAVGVADAEKAQIFRALLANNPPAEQKRMILSGLGEVHVPEALKTVEPLLGDDSIRSEAAIAVAKIAPTLGDGEAATAALKKVLALQIDASTRQNAEAALKQIDARGAFVTAWQVSGPFRQANKNYAALFDIAFEPETKDVQNLRWQVLPPCSEPNRPWAMDLLKFYGGGEQCVAYARTWVYCPSTQPAVFEIGSDDGIKIWLNEKVIHANNTARPLQPAQDKAEATLREGWNHLLVKLTQNNLGWEFCLRALKPDGSRIEGLQVKASPPE